MPLIGFDADQDVSHVAPVAIAKGVRWFARYTKNLSAGEIERIFAAADGVKVGILPIFETGATRALDGAAAGHADGATAMAAAVKLFGMTPKPEWALAATVDFDATAEEQPAVLDYLSAFKQGASGVAYGGAQIRLAVYANGAICAAALDLGIADIAWVAGGSGMRGTRDFLASGRAHIIQDVGDKRGLNLGIDIDSDYAPNASDPEELGCWCETGAVAKPAPSVLPDLKAAQAELGVTADGAWGPQTAAAFARHYAR